MAYMNGAPYGAFPAPNGNQHGAFPAPSGNQHGAFPAPNGNPPMMNHQNRHYGPPRFNNTCPWRPQPERFNISRFMHPPHMVQRPEFVSGNMFGQETSGAPQENFPFASQQNNMGHQVSGHQGHQFKGHHTPPSHQANGQNFQSQQFNGQHFQGHQGRGRGFIRGHHGGQGFRGNFRGGYNNNNTQQNHTNKAKKKEKVDKRDLAENNAFFCDICDRGFKTFEKFKEHTDGHMKCTFKDCPFIAAPKLVQLHMRMQHSTGMAKKVWSMESEEDVKKWRDDRKRNFPTADTVTRKKQERAEKIARGEVLETREFGKMGKGRGRKRHRGRGRGRWRDRNQGTRNEGERNTADGSDDDSPPEEVGIKKSTANDDEDPCMAGLDESSTDRTVTATTQLSSTTAKRNVPEVSLPNIESPVDSSGNSLALLGSYGDSSDDGEVSAEVEASYLASADVSAKTVDPSTVSPSSTHQTSTKTTSDPLASSSQLVVAPHQNSLSPPKKEFGDTSMTAAENTVLSPQKLQTHTSATIVSADQQNSNNNSHSNKKHQDKASNKATHTNDVSSNQNLKEGHAAGVKRGPQSKQEGGPRAKKNKKGPMKQQPCRYTLLQKLLAPDMRRERNKILQCVHHIVKNKFFEKEHSVDKAVPATDLAS